MNLGFLKTLTLGQVLAIFTWVVAQVVAYGWLSSTKSQLVLSAGATIIAAAWHFADAWIHTTTIKTQQAAVTARAAQVGGHNK